MQCLQLPDKPVTSLREAVDRAHRHEAANLAGGTVSVMPLTPVPNRFAVLQCTHDAANALCGPRPPSTFGGGGASKRRSNNNDGGGSRVGAGGVRADRPKCDHPGCRKPLGHTTATCYQRIREEKVDTKAGKRARHDKGKGKKREGSEGDEDPRIGPSWIFA